MIHTLFRIRRRAGKLTSPLVLDGAFFVDGPLAAGADEASEAAVLASAQEAELEWRIADSVGILRSSLVVNRLEPVLLV